MKMEIAPGVFLQVILHRGRGPDSAGRYLRDHRDLFAHVVDQVRDFALETGEEIPPTVYLANDRVLWMLVSECFCAPATKEQMINMVRRFAGKLRAKAFCTVFESYVTLFKDRMRTRKLDAIVIFAGGKGGHHALRNAGGNAGGNGDAQLCKILYRDCNPVTGKLQLVERDEVNDPAARFAGLYADLLGEGAEEDAEGDALN